MTNEVLTRGFKKENPLKCARKPTTIQSAFLELDKSTDRNIRITE